MNNKPKTISFEEVQRFIENDLKVGELYKAVQRKWSDSTYNPYLIELNKDKFIYIEKKHINSVILFCLDEIPVDSPAFARWRHEPPSTPRLEQEQLVLWDKMFVKVLYQNKVCLVHASWLEKL